MNDEAEKVLKDAINYAFVMEAKLSGEEPMIFDGKIFKEANDLFLYIINTWLENRGYHIVDMKFGPIQVVDNPNRPSMDEHMINLFHHLWTSVIEQGKDKITAQETAQKALEHFERCFIAKKAWRFNYNEEKK